MLDLGDFLLQPGIAGVGHQLVTQRRQDLLFEQQDRLRQGQADVVGREQFLILLVLDAIRRVGLALRRDGREHRPQKPAQRQRQALGVKQGGVGVVAGGILA